MFKYLDAVYRVHEYGEIFKGRLEVGKGTLVGVNPELFKIDMRSYDINPRDYDIYNPPNSSDLVKFLCNSRNALVVIAFNNIAAIVVSRVSQSLVMLKNKNVVRVIPNSNRMFDFNYKDIGVVKTELLTLTTSQPDAHLIVDADMGKCLIHDDEGVRYVSISSNYYEEDCSGDDVYSRYMEMVNDDESYCCINTSKGVKIARIEGNELKIFR